VVADTAEVTGATGEATLAGAGVFTGGGGATGSTGDVTGAVLVINC